MNVDRRIRFVAPAWQVAYVAVHLWWVAGNAPYFYKDRESYLFGGWVPVVIGALAVVGCSAAALTRDGAKDSVHRSLAVVNAVAGAALCTYSFLFPLMVVGLLFGGAEKGMVTSLLANGSGVAGGVLCLIVAARERRLAVHACDSCGRVHGRSAETRAQPAPRWAFAGAYVAVAGFAARIGVWFEEVVTGQWPSADAQASLTALLIFVALMSLAGTLLPLALAHRWGRIWPAWTGPLRGREVPRWLVLGTGLFVGASLTAYFGIAGMAAWIRGDFSGPFVPLLLEMGGYTLWGAGLLVAAASYFALTRPPCPELRGA